MRRSNPKCSGARKQRRLSEAQEIQLLDSWIEAGIPDPGTNPLAISAPPPDAPIGRTKDGGFSPYAGVRFFRQLPISQRTKDGLAPKYVEMSDIQRASLPHSLCGRDILGAAKTGSGKTLAFVIPVRKPALVIEKLYRARWGPEDGVGGIIISPTKELAGQLFEELKTVGKFLFSSWRQILVLDEADRILDAGFKTELDAIISQLPKRRQTLLFSATQTKSVKDLARLSLKDPEYISVHAESVTATPEQLTQLAIIVPLDQKLNLLWSFIKANLKSKILVFLSSCKQVCFQHVASRGLDFSAVDWVIQVDCPEDIPAYIHRVGRTARFRNAGKSLLFLMPSEKEMFTKLRAVEPKIPIKLSTRILKKKKLKINMHRPLGTRVKYDDDGNVIPPLAALADKETGDGSIDLGTVKERYEKLREAMKVRDKEDKLLHRQRLHDKRTKEKLKLKKWKEEAEEGDTGDDRSESDENEQRNPKRTKIYFDDDDNDEVDNAKAAKRSDAVALAEQEALALELLRSMHS
ncbi:hypothetical protein B296_00017125 [Ensete ventricosum]|uniref:ATP-dependent RNA helicase n=1 Tax=Ensete ventricosum TaxID=4639 RepID=A0A426ZHI6_ENSVE|nr:hypothetical protein B296_00017125 [Ensete ventricosum]